MIVAPTKDVYCTLVSICHDVGGAPLIDAVCWTWIANREHIAPLIKRLDKRIDHPNTDATWRAGADDQNKGTCVKSSPPQERLPKCPLNRKES